MPGRGAPKRRLILEAARELFLRHGFAETSTDAIALRAGVSKETLYRHYPSKEVLLVAVMEELTVDRLALLAGRSLPPRATREDLEAVLDEILRDALQRLMDRDYLELARLAIGESITMQWPQQQVTAGKERPARQRRRTSAFSRRATARG